MVPGLLLFTLLNLFAGPCATAPAVLYVSPDGDDTWTGRLSTPRGDLTDGPLASIEGARNALRRLGGVEAVVYLRTGTYRLRRPFRLTVDDNGRGGAAVTYAAYPGERPVLSGGRRIGRWRRGEDGVWRARIPSVANGRWRFNQLFVNGRRRTRARTPNEGYLYTAGPAPGALDPSTGQSSEVGNSSFRYANEDLRNWDNLNDICVVVYHSWETSRHRIASVDEARSIVHFTGKAVWPFERWGPRQRYYVENLPEALDQPGEWVLDTASGVLSYLPLPGEDMRTAEVVAPRLTSLVEIAGDAAVGLPVQNITFRGLTFSHQDWVLEPEGHSDHQASSGVPAAITLNGALNCAFEDCEVCHVGGYALWLRRGCTGCRVQRCRIRDIGTGGIRIGETSMARIDAEESKANLIDNNHIFDTGHVYAGGVGIWVSQSSGNRLSHNDIHDTTYSGMSLGWSWSDGDNRCHSNLVERNHVHHVMNRHLNDGGAIYTLGDSPGSILRGNVLHDVWPYSGLGWGIYLDATSSGFAIEDNVVYNCLTGGIMYNNGGHQNTISNNVFAFTAQQALWPYWERRPNAFSHNIVYLTQGTLFIPMAQNSLQARIAAGDPLGEWDHNLYWNPKDPEILFFDEDLAQWHKTGLDLHSVIADPQFLDPEDYDFRFGPDSPAARLGIRSLDTSGVGLYGDPEWVAEPGRYAHAPTVLPPAPLPPGPVAVDDGFEDTAVGERPRGATVSGEERGASIRVSDKRAAAGSRSLEFVDAAGLQQPWQPHMYYTPGFRKGEVCQSFDIYLMPGATLFTEWRDGGETPGRTGPSISFEPDGGLRAGSRLLCVLPHERWIHVEIRAELGGGAKRRFSVTITPPDGPQRRFGNLPISGEGFKSLNWLGMVSMATVPAQFYVDNVRIAPVGGDRH